VRNTFDRNDPTIRTTTHAFSFGLSASRDAYDKVFNPANKSPKNQDFPGPDRYQYRNGSIGNSSVKFSFRPRTRNQLEPAEIMKKCEVPGPGTYAPIIGINSVGKYMISNQPNSRASVWSPAKNRF